MAFYSQILLGKTNEDNDNNDEEVLDDMETEDLSNENENENDTEMNAKRELSGAGETNESPKHKLKRRSTIHPSGSEEDANSESDAGQNPKTRGSRIMHSTLRQARIYIFKSFLF